MELRGRMREAREAAGLTQGQAARLLSVSRALVTAWEDGTRRIGEDKIAPIASLYDVSEVWLRTGQCARPDLLAEAEGVLSRISPPARERVAALLTMIAGAR